MNVIKIKQVRSALFDKALFIPSRSATATNFGNSFFGIFLICETYRFLQYLILSIRSGMIGLRLPNDRNEKFGTWLAKLVNNFEV